MVNVYDTALVMFLRVIHNLKSKSRKGFGIHSPFVYQFQREILNSKARDYTWLSSNKRKQRRVFAMLIRMIKHFELSKLLIFSTHYQKEFEIEHLLYDSNPKQNTKYDLLVLDAMDSTTGSFLSRNSFVMLIGNQEQMNQNFFRQKCDVFLNLYDFGICIFREGLSRQEFDLKF